MYRAGVEKYLLAVVGEVDPKIHEVKFTATDTHQDVLQLCLCHLIRNVSKHDLEKC